MRASFEQEFGSDDDALDIDEFDSQDDIVDVAEPASDIDFDDEDDEDEAPAKGRKSNLSNRLPREDFAPVAFFDDRPPLIERCQEILKDRLKIKNGCFFLDRNPVHTDKVVEAAGLQYLEDEAPMRSPPPRRPKRRRKVL
ncbi:hypothetical protein HOU02_gp499 [Caulobacter phage CcrBL9]|uniref:Uncharacterized protein n=1 Tax=Caulobacter phage CcrBL9 TaxID=2283270 RepID=A0A385EC12_9CAUD|nr:hypothetical protein HOU02_gp499 [Caulobacter phage CcrBL9]AXQ69226.1 hypothetical protein CcrBL9_gp202 [Caulobacter phage CcrBL9]